MLRCSAHSKDEAVVVFVVICGVISVRQLTGRLEQPVSRFCCAQSERRHVENRVGGEEPGEPDGTTGDPAEREKWEEQ